MSRRNGCQHTSCKACFLLVRPNCDQYKCIEPPNKRCLRQYYECIRNHYFSPPQNGSYPVMMVSMHIELKGRVCRSFGCSTACLSGAVCSQDLLLLLHLKWSSMWLLLTGKGGTCYPFEWNNCMYWSPQSQCSVTAG